MNAPLGKRVRPRTLLALGISPMLLPGCSQSLDTVDEFLYQTQLSCSIPIEHIQRGAFRDAIPALTQPELGPFGAGGTEYLTPADRVIGLLVGEQPVAVPLNILWWHEIVNLTLDETSLAVTHCPLTGSSVVFDRGAAADAAFGVSGLLYQNNLIMYDRSDDESMWPQMMRGARCGVMDGTPLPMVPMAEMTWDGWVKLHPNTLVVVNPGVRDYTRSRYPYGAYDLPNNRDLLFPMPQAIDTRRPPKERALGVPAGTGGVVFPFGELRAAAQAGGSHVVAVQSATPTGDVVIFWDDSRKGGMVFHPVIDDDALTFRSDQGVITDVETGSRWTLEGAAVDGPLAGRALDRVPEAFVAFWFAWPAFYPDLELWSAS